MYLVTLKCWLHGYTMTYRVSAPNSHRAASAALDMAGKSTHTITVVEEMYSPFLKPEITVTA